MKFSYALVCLPALTAAAAVTKTVVVPAAVLEPGTVYGVATSVPVSNRTVYKFVGIPYAVTPPRRFLPPEKLEHFQGGFVNATTLPLPCFQAHNNAETAEEMALESEDCLYINVYTPAGGDCKSVMFWIYGGDLQNGDSANALFDGTTLAATQDVTVVTFNYRVNAFGFPNAPNLPLTSRNVGFLDQRFALQWVQENIAHFGGNPNEVTIFGESSGASSVDRLVTTMIDNPPFRGAIGQSGQATLSVFPNDSGPKAWTALVAALNCTSATGDQDAEFACMQAADAHTIRSFVAGNSFPYFTPVNDNVTQRATPYLDARKAGEVAKVPVIYGANGQEGLFLAQVYLITNFSTVTEDAVYALIYGMTGDNATAKLFLQETLNIQKQYPWLDTFEAGAQLYTEVIYQCAAKLVTHASVNASIPAWRYYYNATIANVQPAGFPNLHASHGSELPMVWGNFNRTTATDQEVALSSAIQKAWADFAKNPEKGPGWKMVDETNDDLACIGCNGDFGIQIISEDLVDERCALFDGLYTAPSPYF